MFCLQEDDPANRQGELAGAAGGCRGRAQCPSPADPVLKSGLCRAMERTLTLRGSHGAAFLEVGLGGGIPPSQLLGRRAEFWGAKSAQHFWPRGASTWILVSLPPLPPPLKK